MFGGAEPFVISHRQKQASLAIIDPRVTAIEQRRARAGMSHNILCARAGVHPSTWSFLRAGQQAPRPETLKRLAAALDGRSSAPPDVIAALVNAAQCMLAAAVAGDARLIAALTWRRPGRRGVPATVVPARLKRVAVYLAAVELCVGNAAIARALNVSRQNIKQTRDQVEDLRGNDAVDRLLTKVATDLRGTI